ncbi:protein of unknown function [Paenibacillus polysaccharolyticus]|uniref:DNA mimic protein DMP19 C-terminal domain-containing protein n=1 Tax=Paenibacillus polysaccharolyticus TaxID=582692 RepID=A0A1G5E644_9BACL|nr:DUF4375 domain-containing protein [Paenibacillus polysaccharolyticus]SCY22211.1 protein of unknown function [Paenibacillus polysaccharolyticus]
MSERDIQDVWYDYALTFVEKKNRSAQGWTALSQTEQEIAALWLFEADVYNGGFIQFFCNWGEEAYKFACKALETIGANQVLSNVKQQYACFEHLENDSRLTWLWDIPKYLETEQEERLDELDQQLWNNEDQVAEKAYAHYHDELRIRL